MSKYIKEHEQKKACIEEEQKNTDFKKEMVDKFDNSAKNRETNDAKQ